MQKMKTVLVDFKTGLTLTYVNEALCMLSNTATHHTSPLADCG